MQQDAPVSIGTNAWSLSMSFALRADETCGIDGAWFDAQRRTDAMQRAVSADGKDAFIRV